VNKCWAAPLGDCSDKLSREHIISDSVFESAALRVKGLSWCLDDWKEISLKNLVRKALCESHNSRLSETDNAAGNLRKTLCESGDLSTARLSVASTDWDTRKFEVDGRRLERWFLKTLMSLAFGGTIMVGGESTEPGIPTLALVKAAFGFQNLGNNRAGLYLLGGSGSEIAVREGVGINTFTGNSGRLEGARFWFWGMRFLLLLNEEGSRPPWTFTTKSGELQQENPLYHPGRIRMAVQGVESHVFNFKW
jgi:hypothetical protein